MMKLIDPHLHLFDLDHGDYHWLKADCPPFWSDKAVINKNFSAQDLLLDSSLDLAGFIHIEAGFDNERPWRELTALENTNNSSFRAIANIDLTSTSDVFQATLKRLMTLQSFIGVRHILDEQVLSLLANPQVISNIQALNAVAKSTRLIFETQISLSAQAPVNAICQIIKENGNLNFIINHAGFPPVDINTVEWQHWQNNLMTLAEFNNLAIKCSGWEMAERSYQLDWVNTVLTFIYNTLGPDKMMLASNFPLCLFSQESYQDYWQMLLNSVFFQQLTTQEKSALCYDNALRYYQL